MSAIQRIIFSTAIGTALALFAFGCGESSDAPTPPKPAATAPRAIDANVRPSSPQKTSMPAAASSATRSVPPLASLIATMCSQDLCNRRMVSLSKSTAQRAGTL